MRRISAALAVVAFAVALAAAATALAHGWDDDWNLPDIQQGSTSLTLSVDKPVVFPGQTVMLQGQLTAEAPDTSGDQTDSADPTDTVDPTDPGSSDPATPSAGKAPAAAAISCWGDDGDGSDWGDDSSGDTSAVPVAGAEVAIYSVIGDEQSLVTTVTTGDDGSFAIPVQIDHGMHFYATYDGDDTNDPAQSDVVNVHVFAATGAPKPAGPAVAGHAIVVRGSANGSAGAVTVTVRRTNGHVVRSAQSGVRRGAYSATFKLPAGTYRISAEQSGGNGYLGTSSRATALKVRRAH
jgi:hypothetical protein